MAEANRITTVAIVGASGRIGSHFVDELLKTGQHIVTALTRAESTSTIPPGVHTVRVDYDDEPSLISALEGQQFLVITLTALAPPDTSTKLVKAAVKAGIKYVMPNTYGADITNGGLIRDDPDLYTAGALQRCEEIKSLGASFISMACGFWYEFSLAGGEDSFGIDVQKRTANILDDGMTHINVSTMRQCGRALAALLSLPTAEIEKRANQTLYISSFEVSQREILDTIHGVLGTKDQDWSITSEPSKQRYQCGLELMQRGDMTGFKRAMYSRAFYPNSGCTYGAKLANQRLGLPKEDLVEVTKWAVRMIGKGWDPTNDISFPE